MNKAGDPCRPTPKGRSKVLWHNRKPNTTTRLYLRCCAPELLLKAKPVPGNLKGGTFLPHLWEPGSRSNFACDPCFLSRLGWGPRTFLHNPVCLGIRSFCQETPVLHIFIWEAFLRNSEVQKRLPHLGAFLGNLANLGSLSSGYVPGPLLCMDQKKEHMASGSGNGLGRPQIWCLWGNEWWQFMRHVNLCNMVIWRRGVHPYEQCDQNILLASIAQRKSQSDIHIYIYTYMHTLEITWNESQLCQKVKCMSNQICNDHNPSVNISTGRLCAKSSSYCRKLI